MAKYTLREAPRKEFPPIDILERKDGLLAARFGKDIYNVNVQAMKGPYSNPIREGGLSFSPATTTESLDIAVDDFPKRAKVEVFDPSWLQAGRIGRASEGVYINLPVGKNGKPIIDEGV